MMLTHRRTAFIVLLVSVFLIYGNTFSSSWHLDDLQNILSNKYLHIGNLSFESLWQAAHADPMHPGTLYRPVACMSLAINWYFGKDHVFGYHLVNISIHVVTAFLLYLLILKLFQTPNIKDRYKSREHDIALIASLLWAINPIQTQAVTYIVQRMASMAAMFYVLGMLFYLKARLSPSNRERVGLSALCLVSFLLAIGSKENALIFPFALILLEVTFFQNLCFRKKKLIHLGIIVSLAALIIFSGYFLLRQSNPFSFLNGYGNRPFTLKQRLLSEPRIIVLYLSQIFLPSSSSLSITHDFSISTSLFTPWATFPSILFVAVLVFFGFYQINRSPLFSFAILFFFLNHLIESSIIPLELIFEHRNYLPSMFLFVPIAIGFIKLVNRYSLKLSFMSVFIYVASVLIIISIALSTRTRNMAWATEKTLWEDAMKKAPESARPIQNLATSYYFKMGVIDKSFKLYKKALQKRGNHNNYKAPLYYNLGLICFGKGKYNESIHFYRKGLEVTPKESEFYYHMSMSYIMTGKLEDALNTINIPLSHGVEKVDCLYLKGLILLKMDQPLEAIPLFRKIISITTSHNKENRLAWGGLGVAENMLGRPFIAERFFKQAHRMAPKDISIILELIEASVRRKDMSEANKYLNELFFLSTDRRIVAILDSAANYSLNPPLDSKLIKPIIAKKLEEKAKKIEKESANLISGQ